MDPAGIELTTWHNGWFSLYALLRNHVWIHIAGLLSHFERKLLISKPPFSINVANMLPINPQKGQLRDEKHITSSSCEGYSRYESGHNAGTLHSVLFCDSLHFHVHVDVLVQDCGNYNALAMELLQSCTKPSMYCYSKPVLTHFFRW